MIIRVSGATKTFRRFQGHPSRLRSLAAMILNLPSPKGGINMAGIWRNNPETPEGKYLVKRRDGTVPLWPHFVIAASDPAAPSALRAYANAAERLGMDRQYVADIRGLAGHFEDWRNENGDGDPDAPRHRKDDPATVAEMRKGSGG
jgi:hypothetical protein